MLRTVWIVVAIAVLASFAAIVPAAANCRAWEAELAQLQRQAGGARAQGQNERAWREQAYILQQLKGQARQAGCFGGGFLFFRAQPHPMCGTLVPRIGQMEQKLAQLGARRTRGGGEANASRMRQLANAIATQGCRAPKQQQAAVRPRRSQSLQDLPPDGDTYSAAMSRRGGTFRTLCVRTCDGYYFPISFATGRGQFAHDLQTCEALCPGTQVELFYHSNPGQESEDMVSATTDQPYATLATAFRYRQNFDKACTCGAVTAGAFRMIGTTPDLAAEAETAGRPQETITPALPRSRAAPGEDPETLANFAGGFGPVAPKPGRAVASVSSDGSRSVRIVGPVYWGGPKTEGVVLTPVPN